MRGPIFTRVMVGAILLGGFTSTGCVTAKKYKLAKENTPPARALAWGVSIPSAELRLATVIVFKGAGSWKREARWDEYVVEVTNRGGMPLAIDFAGLVDIQGTMQLPGADPWKLEKLSYTNWDKYGKTGLKLLAGAGAVTLYVGAGVGLTYGALLGGTVSSGAVAAMNLIPVVALVDVTTVAVMNHKNKQKVVAEFNRRRLPLPQTIAPGQTVAGSLFFPMTPGPQRLVLKGQSGAAPLDLTLELKPLASLHLKPAETKGITPP
jgi:hypothetical protein